MHDKVPKEEIEKWLNRLDAKLERIKPKTKKGEEIIANARAYRQDCEHWLKEENLFLSFESVVWAWAIIETAESLEQFSENHDKRQ